MSLSDLSNFKKCKTLLMNVHLRCVSIISAKNVKNVVKMCKKKMEKKKKWQSFFLTLPAITTIIPPKISKISENNGTECDRETEEW